MLSQTLTTYDAAGNVTLTTDKERFDNDLSSSTGDLGGPSTSPDARVSYVGNWYDAANRLTDSVNFGTNNSVSYPTTVPTLPPGKNIVSQATASGTTTTLVDAGRTEASSYFLGYTITITAGTDSGQTAVVTGFNGSTGTITFSPPFSSATDSTSVYKLAPPTPVTGKASSGSTTTLVDSHLTGPTSFYVGYKITITAGTDAGQTSVITAYNSSTNTLTFSPALSSAIDSTSVYYLAPGAVSGTASSGSTTTLVDSNLAQPGEMFVGWTLNILAGTDAGKSAIVTDYNSSTHTLTFAPAFASAIDSTSVYSLTLPALLSHTDYDSAGRGFRTIDAKGLATVNSFDMLDRTTQTVAAWDGNIPSSSHYDRNQTTNYTYDGNDNILTMTAEQPGGTNQTTGYLYGVGGGNNNVFSNDLLAKVEYPDPTTGAASTTSTNDQSYSYNALGEKTYFSDQNGSTHNYLYDLLGRLTADIVTTAGSGVDTNVLRLGYSFDTGGRPYQQTSYSDTGGTTVVNQEQEAYNGFGQLITQYQEHSGSVNTAANGSERVQYVYTETNNGTENDSRLVSMIFPNTAPSNGAKSRAEDYLYGGSSEVTSLTLERDHGYRNDVHAARAASWKSSDDQRRFSLGVRWDLHRHLGDRCNPLHLHLRG